MFPSEQNPSTSLTVLSRLNLRTRSRTATAACAEVAALVQILVAVYQGVPQGRLYSIYRGIFGNEDDLCRNVKAPSGTRIFLGYP